MPVSMERRIRQKPPPQIIPPASTRTDEEEEDYAERYDLERIYILDRLGEEQWEKLDEIMLPLYNLEYGIAVASQ